MKGNSLVVIFALLLAGLSVVVTLLAAQYIQLTRKLNRAQSTIGQVEARHNRLKALVGEAMEYSQRQPAINPLLQAIGAKPGPAAPAAAAAPTSSLPPATGR